MSNEETNESGAEPTEAIDNGDDLESNLADESLESNTYQEQIEILQQAIAVCQRFLQARRSEVVLDDEAIRQLNDLESPTTDQEQIEILQQAMAVCHIFLQVRRSLLLKDEAIRQLNDPESNMLYEEILEEMLHHGQELRDQKFEILQRATTVYQSFLQVAREVLEAEAICQLLVEFAFAVDLLEAGDFTALDDILQHFSFIQRLVQIGGSSKIEAASNKEWIEIMAEFKDDPSALYFILREDPGRFKNVN